MIGPCPTTEQLTAVLRGRGGDRSEEELAAHLSDCAACQARLEALAGGSSWLNPNTAVRVENGVRASEPLRHAMDALVARSEPAASGVADLDFLELSKDPALLGRFASYEVLAHIASGGMGIVLKARDPSLNRIVALKILPRALAASPLARARFVREARAAAAVVHEHVVPIYAVDEWSGLPYLVMQFIHGRTLGERIRATGPLRLEEILRIGAQAAAGLAAAHAQGLVHRDVKPGNILLENSVERVKLTDFGLARAADDVVLTRTGELAGTPEFMAPEQAGGGEVDHRSDLFSFGSVLYAMCTGKSPFQATSVIAMVRKVCDEEPRPVHEINAKIPEWLSSIIAKLMAKSPDARFQSAQELRDVLERYLARVQHGDRAPMPGSPRLTPPKRRRWQLAAGLAATVVLAAAVFFGLKNKRRPAEESSPPLAEWFIVQNESGARLGGYARLEDALERIPSDGIIELRWNGPRDIPAITLPAKALTVRAASGFQPEWTVEDLSAPALSARAALALEGIRFVTNPGSMEPQPEGARVGRRPGFRRYAPRVTPSGFALVTMSGGSLRITQCALELKARGMREIACVILSNVVECRVENTTLLALQAKAIVLQESRRLQAEGARLTLTNCVTVAAEAVWLDVAEPSTVRIEVSRATFSGPTSFYFSPSFAGQAQIDAQQTLFETASVMMDGRNAGVPSLQQKVRWRERENLFSPAQQYLIQLAVVDGGPASLREWDQWWGQSGTGSRQVWVDYTSGRSSRNRGAGRPPDDARDLQIKEFGLLEGPPLEEADWPRFGADIRRVGPASPL